MNNMMGGSLYLGRFFGINVRVHWTLFLFWLFRLPMFIAIARASGLDKLASTVAMIVLIGIFLSILFHEFGHSLTCKLFKGDATEILMWPLGGLAFCRPPHHATAHLLTTIMGPMVTLVLWLLCSFGLPLVFDFPPGSAVGVVIDTLGWVNLYLLVFNMLPGFPMDGGRIVRDTLWHFIGFEKATRFAVWMGRATGAVMIMSGFGLVDLPVLGGGMMMTLIGVFVLMSNADMDRVLMAEGAGQLGYSMKDHMKHAKRRAEFNKTIARSEEALHKCETCGKTEFSDPSLEFRVAADGEEYCEEHLPAE